MRFEKEIRILEKLGLTSSQATIYLTMFNLGAPTAKEIYKNTSVARQDVYRVLSELEEEGLVERIVAKPTRFRPTPIKNALSILLDKKYDEASQLRKQAVGLFASSELWTKTKMKMMPEQSFEIRRVYVNDPRVKSSFASSRNAVRLLEGTIDWAVFSSFVGDMESVLEKGVKIRIITETATKQQKMPEFMDILEKHPLFEMRFRQTLFPTKLILFDDREVAVWYVTSTSHNMKKPQALWSTHRGLVELSSNYFEVLWNTASK